MGRLFSIVHPVWTVESSLGVLATLHDNDHEDVQGVGELDRVVKLQDHGEGKILTQKYARLMPVISSRGRGSLKEPSGTGLPSGGET